MLTCSEQIDNLEDLREYVNEAICNQYQLQNGAFPVTERVLLRAGKPCGLQFCLHGPRATQYSAIWDIDHGQILFYGSGGERFQKTMLAESPEFEFAGA
jgi:hypothetical protein